MTNLHKAVKALLVEREEALERMYEEFDRAQDNNNVFMQGSTATSITELTLSIETLKRTLEEIVMKGLK